MVMGACLLLFPLPLDRVLGCTRFLHRARVSQLLGTAEGLVVEFDPEMQVRAVLYHPELVSDELYHAALVKVDLDAQAKIKRFYRREDACRTLIGALLLRLLLGERGINLTSFEVAKTPEGKPYLLNQTLEDPIGFNITHDNSLISMAFAPGVHNQPAFSIGIDVMRTQIPARDAVDSFIAVFEEQLTALEKSQLTSDVPEKERIKRFFWMWTVKEAYTKALGLGLGFDFARVEFDAVQIRVRVDGEEPRGWKFTMFEIPDGEDWYEGVVAEFVGGDGSELNDERGKTCSSWLTVQDAASVLKQAVDVLPSVTA